MTGSIRALAAVLAIATLIGAAAGTAQADPRDRRERAPARHYRHPSPPPRQNWGYGGQSYVQAPPPVVYAPPPLPFALNFQLNFR